MKSSTASNTRAARASRPIKINTVVQRGVNDHTLLDLLAHFRGTGVIVRFIEYMDVGTRNHWNPALVVPSRELAAMISARWPLVPRDRDYRGEVAERHVFADGTGEVGFISSVSQPFCGDCSRARISSDGSFYTCLFATQGMDLRAPLRAGASDEELYELVRGVWSGRRDRYSELRASLRDAAELHKVEMNYIGGWDWFILARPHSYSDPSTNDRPQNSPTSTPRTAPPWSTWAPRPRPSAKPAPRPSSNYRRRSRAS